MEVAKKNGPWMARDRYVCGDFYLQDALHSILQVHRKSHVDNCGPISETMGRLVVGRRDGEGD